MSVSVAVVDFAPMHAIHRNTSNVGGDTAGQVRHNFSPTNELNILTLYTR